MANKAAKNINSLDSQTIVPIETIFGRSAWLGTRTAETVLTPQVYPPTAEKSPQATQKLPDVTYCIYGP